MATSDTDFEGYLERGAAHFAADRVDEAVATLQQAAAVASSPVQLLQAANLLNRFGRRESAIDLFRAVIASDPASVPGYYGLAPLQRTHEPAHVTAMTALLAAQTEPMPRIQLNFALGKIFADEGDFDRSFEHYRLGNLERRQQMPYDGAPLRKRLDQLRRVFQPSLFEGLRHAGLSKFQPIFIVGMPRSGSTLVEQVLSSHPSVFGGGELPLTANIIQATCRQYGRNSVPDLLRDAKAPLIMQMAKAYRDPALRAISPKTRITDKYLDNFWNVGMLRLMFPNARVIHCVRDPLDNAISIYRQLFANTGPRYAYDFGDMADYFHLHDAVMQHWNEVLPGFVLRLSYEQLVTDFEATAKQLVAFVDLPWGDNYLAFHKADRVIKTASYAQARSPLYGDAIGSAKPYEKHLGPLIEALRG